MKASDLTLFIICLAIGLAFVSLMGIGGEEAENLGFFGGTDALVVGITIGLIAGIGVAAAASYLAPKGVVGTTVALYGGFIGSLIGLSAAFFYGLPYGIGALAGTSYVLFATVVLFLDISERVMQSG